LEQLNSGSANGMDKPPGEALWFCFNMPNVMPQEDLHPVERGFQFLKWVVVGSS
jgi:hypothetical protein